MPRAMVAGQALAAKLVCGDDLGRVRARALWRLREEEGLWRAMVLDAHSGQMVGVVTRAAPHWELPLTLRHESFAAH